MPNPVGGNRPPQTNFDKISQDMDKTADKLKDAAKDQMREAGRSVGRAGEHAVDAGAHLAGAAANAIFATAKTAEGVARTAQAAGHAAAAGALGATGAVGWTVETVAEGGRFVAKNTAKGFAAIANGLTRILGDGKTTTVRELEGDPTAVRFSEKMFGHAADQLQKSGDAMNLAWNAYVNAVGHVAGAGVNLVMAAGHTAAVAGNLALAAAQTGAAGTIKLAEFGVRVGSLGVQAAEQGVKGARELAILSAKFSAGVANVLAQPDQGRVEVQVQTVLKQYEDELKALMDKEPTIKQMPEAQQLKTDINTFRQALQNNAAQQR